MDYQKVVRKYKNVIFWRFLCCMTKFPLKKTCFSDVYSHIPLANTCICPKHMTDRQILLAKIFLFSQPYGYFMDTIKSFCTEQNQTDYSYFDTGIIVIFVMQNLLF